jgi:flagellar protein FlaG
MDINNNVAVSNATPQKPVVADGSLQVDQAKRSGDSTSQPQNQVAKVSEIDPKAVQDAVEKLSEFVETVSNRGLQISVDEDLSQVILKVVNKDNEETIRQIPTEEVMELMKRMRDISEEFFGDATGLLVENKV